jgi:hypothetical protein
MRWHLDSQPLQNIHNVNQQPFRNIMLTQSTSSSQLLEMESRDTDLLLRQTEEDGSVYDTALRTERRDIRLVTLLPGQADEEMKATLRVVSLDTSPLYEALSYVWGDPTITRDISLNGHMFSVTENLEAALRQLRHPQEERSFWVDAICVNQHDLPERKSQVSLMAAIFSSCNQCTVWLGKEGATTQQAMHLIESMAIHDGHFKTWPFSSPEYQASLKAHEIFKGDSEISRQPKGKIFEPLMPFFQKPWWSRTWTVQELILPNRTILKCGRHDIEWKTVSQAYELLDKHLYRCCKHSYNGFGFRAHWALYTFQGVVSALVSSRLAYHNRRVRVELVELLAEYHEREASDPRDKVYGFLSLCHQDVQERFGADYYAELVDCYAWPTIDDIERLGHLRSLGLVLRNEPDSKLPSWVPDWSRSSGRRLDSPTEGLRLYNLFSAANGSTALFLRQSHILSLWGIRIETISDIGVSADMFCDPFDALGDWFCMWEHCEDASRIDGGDEDGSNKKGTDKIPVAFFRTIMLDTIPPFNQPNSSPASSQDPLRAKPEDYEHCRRWWPLTSIPGSFVRLPLQTKDTEAELMDHMQQHVTVSTAHRRFFITKHGSIGLGPRSMEEGDEVWVVCGGKMPLVLRRTKLETPSGSNADPQPHYTLVGDCYVDGIMDGEAASNLMKDKVEVRIV